VIKQNLNTPQYFLSLWSACRWRYRLSPLFERSQMFPICRKEWYGFVINWNYLYIHILHIHIYFTIIRITAHLAADNSELKLTTSKDLVLNIFLD